MLSEYIASTRKSVDELRVTEGVFSGVRCELAVGAHIQLKYHAILKECRSQTLPLIAKMTLERHE